MTWEPGNPEYDELTALYEEIEADGMWVKEIVTAAVGDLRDLDALAELAGKPRNEVYDALGLGDLIDLTGGPGEGATRADCVRDAWKKAQHARDTGYLPRLIEARKKAELPLPENTKRLGTF